MRQISVLLIWMLFFGITNIHAQTAGTTLNYNSLEKKIEKNNEDIQHDRKKLKAKTWMERGELFQDIADVDVELLRPEMPVTEIKLYYGEPNEIKTETDEKTGKQKEIYVYDRVNLTIIDDLLKSWNKTKVIHEEPFKMAIEAYNKAIELDEKDKIDDDLKENMKRMKSQLEIRGILSFSQGNYKKAYEFFDLYATTSEFDVFEGLVDTIIYYNAGLSAANAKLYDEAISYYEKAKEYNYGGENLYFYLKDAYLAKNDSASALKVLKDGFDRFPESNLILVELINYYLNKGESDAALEYLNLAKKADPENKSFYFAEGTLYDKMGEKDLAVKAYQEAVAIDDEYFDAYYNLGVLFYNKAVELYNKANETLDNEEYQTIKKEADSELKNALGPIEKCHEIEPDYLPALETLKTIYYRLQMEDKHESTVKKIEELKANATE